MTRMIPAYFKEKIKNYGENYVFNLLRDAPETDDWIALHSYNIPNQINCAGREIDFLVMHKTNKYFFIIL